MAFHGEQLDTCMLLTFTSASCIIVTGDPPNPCGHALLFADGHYFHVAGAISRPFHLDAGLQALPDRFRQAGAGSL
jgi:hypothetical protein